MLSEKLTLSSHILILQASILDPLSCTNLHLPPSSTHHAVKSPVLGGGVPVMLRSCVSVVAGLAELRTIHWGPGQFATINGASISAAHLHQGNEKNFCRFSGRTCGSSPTVTSIFVQNLERLEYFILVVNTDEK